MSSSIQIVLKVTGKVFNDREILGRHVDVYRKLIGEGQRLVIVVGGGVTARKNIELARKLGVRSNYWLDTIGIEASRLNSLIVISALQPYSYPKTPSTLEETLAASHGWKAVVLGGLIPAQSTSSVALEVAEALGAGFIVDFSAVGRLYDKDPARYRDAKPITEITASQLMNILQQRIEPGTYEFIDKKALEIALRSGITIYVADYKHPEDIYKILRGENPGTIIRSS